MPLVSFGEDCSCRYTAVNALHRVGRECDFVFTSRSIASLEAAVLAGLGIMVLPRCRVPQTALSIWEDAPLPELPQLYCGIYLREGGNRVALEELADEIAAVLRPSLQLQGEPRRAPVGARERTGYRPTLRTERPVCRRRQPPGPAEPLRRFRGSHAPARARRGLIAAYPLAALS